MVIDTNEIINFVDGMLQTNTVEYLQTKPIRLSTIYWYVGILNLLPDQKHKLHRNLIIEFVQRCQKPCGMFSGDIDYPPNILATLNALQIFYILDYKFFDLKIIYTILKDYIHENGSVRHSLTGEYDTRFSCCAILIMHILLVNFQNRKIGLKKSFLSRSIGLFEYQEFFNSLHLGEIRDQAVEGLTNAPESINCRIANLKSGSEISKNFRKSKDSNFLSKIAPEQKKNLLFLKGQNINAVEDFGNNQELCSQSSKPKLESLKKEPAKNDLDPICGSYGSLNVHATDKIKLDSCQNRVHYQEHSNKNPLKNNKFSDPSTQRTFVDDEVRSSSHCRSDSYQKDVHVETSNQKYRSTSCFKIQEDLQKTFLHFLFDNSDSEIDGVKHTAEFVNEINMWSYAKKKTIKMNEHFTDQSYFEMRAKFASETDCDNTKRISVSDNSKTVKEECSESDCDPNVSALVFQSKKCKLKDITPKCMLTYIRKNIFNRLIALVDHIINCQNFDGGFGADSFCESHAANTFCALSSLKCLGLLNILNDKVLYFIVNRQLSDGFNGRINKKPDVCYSYWAYMCTRILDKNYSDEKTLKESVLACYDRGGFSDRPGNVPDLFHTLYALCSLSFLGVTTLDQANICFGF